ncbi:MAG TPA: hypothetical protein VGQ38_18150 [Gaiellaceae bacterium]|jgi:hypothetical protein|nr:hypothetical protein [Gaiellaceae bacterium]
MVAADTPAAPVAHSQSASVRISQAAPLALKGVHFVGGEHVRVVVKLGAKRAVRQLTVDAEGGFLARFPTFKVVRCGPSLSVSAIGSSGSKVSWDLNQVSCGAVSVN